MSECVLSRQSIWSSCGIWGIREFLTDEPALLSLLQEVLSRASLWKTVVHLGQGLLLLVLVIVGSHWGTEHAHITY